MRKTSEILRLRWEKGLSIRQIASSVGLSRSTVQDRLARADLASLSWPLPEGMTDDALEELLFPSRQNRVPDRQLNFAYIHKELMKKGVTLELLWTEYKRENPDGYQYSWFCDLYHKWRGQIDVSMRQVHKAGERLFVDWAGQTVPIVDRDTGETRPAYLFVAVLGASNYHYAEASLTQDLPSWIAAHCRALAFIGGVPSLIIPDNAKTAVVKPDYYEPDVHATYQEMADHYGTVILPARIKKPKYKAKVERGVRLSENWLLAPLRNHTFFGLFELNQALSDSLKGLNERPFQKLEGSRKIMFEAVDKPALKPLPPAPYEFAYWKRGKVNIDCHVQIENNFYSAPYKYVQKKIDARITANTVELFFKGERIASHPLSHGRGKYETDSSHFSPAHKNYLEWTPERLINWAETVGHQTAELVQRILETRTHPEQGYRSCLGIMRLAKRYPQERMEAACRRALDSGACSYKSVNSILEKGLDQVPFSGAAKAPTYSRHANIRGPEYYSGKEE
jgi:transposase